MDLHDYSDVAENYDLYTRSIAQGRDFGAIDFHLDMARQYGGGGILDIACGTGRTMIPMLQTGFNVTGIDISKAMLSVLEQKLSNLPSDARHRANTVCSNMTDFFVDEPASLAVIPLSGFMHLLTPSEQEKALKNIYRYLLPGGVLSFNTFDPDYALIAANLKGTNPPLRLRTEYTNVRNHKERIWNKTEFDPTHQLLEMEWKFEELDENGDIIEQRVRPAKMRYSFETETRHLLRLSGFEVLTVYSSYEKAPRRGYCENLIWVARRVG